MFVNFFALGDKPVLL